MNIKLLLGSFLNFCYNDIITHVPVHFVRKGFLRLFNKRIDGSAVILMHVKILNFWKISIGRNTIINQGCLLDCRRYNIVLADNVDIGPYSRIWTLGHNPDSGTHELYGGDVLIEDHVWVASGATLLPGIIIGRGAVIAASSVVHKSVGSLDIVGGNPAKFIRKRNNPLSYNLNYNPIFE